MVDQRPYAALFAKGEERRQRILEVAQRLMARNGWRGTTLGQIAKEAGVSPAGLLHHFESKDHLLHAVLDARDAYDLANSDPEGELLEQFARVTERFRGAPELIGTFAVLLVENLHEGTPLHERLLGRRRDGVRIIAEAIRRGQRAGRYRAEVDPDIKAVEIVAFINGMETSWLLDPSTPVDEVFRGYTRSLVAQLALPVEAG